MKTITPITNWDQVSVGLLQRVYNITSVETGPEVEKPFNILNATYRLTESEVNDLGADWHL